MSRAALVLARAGRVLPGLWAGWTLCVALLATPAVFATLLPSDAGRAAGRMLGFEAKTALVLGVLMLLLQRWADRRDARPGFSADTVLVLGALFCTVAGYFALQPMMAAARLGHGALNFGQLHALSAAFYAAKLVLLLALAWRAAGAAAVSPEPSS